MKRMQKTFLLAGLALASAAVCAVGATHTYNTAAEQAATSDLVMETGASIRMDISNVDGEVTIGSGTGVRFSAKASGDLVSQLVENGEYKSGAELGMFIVPAKYVSDYQAQSTYTDYFEYIEEVKQTSKETITDVFPAEKLSTTEENKINVTLESLYDVNYNLDYQSVAYYTLDGKTYYSSPSETRRVAQVAHEALIDEETTYTSDQYTALGNIVEKSIILKNGFELEKEGSAYYALKLNQSEEFDFHSLFDFAGDTLGEANVTTSKVNSSGADIELDGATGKVTTGLVKSSSSWYQVRMSAYGGKVDLRFAVTISVKDKNFTWNGVEMVSHHASNIDENGGIEFLAGTYTGKNATAMGTADVPYVAFKGEYNYDNSIAVDFTGGNMPNIAFFADQPDEDTKNFVGAQGLMFSQGVLNTDGSVNSSSVMNRMNIYGPTMFTNFKGDAVASLWGNLTATGSETGSTWIGYSDMKENTTTQYRLLVTFYAPQANGNIRYSVVLMQKNADYDGTTNTKEYTLVYNSGIKTVSSSSYDTTYANNVTAGSIIIYGRPYETTKIDKIHSIYTGNSISNTKVQEWTDGKIW